MVGIALALAIGGASLWWSWHSSISNSRQLSQATVRAERLENAFLEDLRQDVKDSTDRLIRAAPDQTQTAKDALRNLASRWQKLADSVATDQRRILVFAEANLRLGKILVALGESAQATESIESASTILDKLRQVSPDEPKILEKTISLRNGRANVLRFSGKADQAIQELVLARQEAQKLSKSQTQSVYLQELLGIQHQQLGMLEQLQGRYEESSNELEIAKDIFMNLTKVYPSVPNFKERVASVANSLGVTRFLSGDISQGVELSNLAKDTWKSLADEDDFKQEYRKSQAEVQMNLGVMLTKANLHEDSIRALESGMQVSRQLSEQFPERIDFLLPYVRAYTILSGVYRAKGDQPQAFASVDKSIELFAKATEYFPDSVELRDGYATALLTRGDLFLGNQQYQNSLVDYERALQVIAKLPRLSAGQAYPRDLASVLLLCAEAHKQLGNSSRSLEYYRRAKDRFQGKLNKSPGDPQTSKSLEAIDRQITDLEKNSQP